MFIILLLLVVLVVSLYKFTYDYDYWKRKGVPYIKPLPLVGNALPVFAFRLSMGALFQKLYLQMKTSYFGIYILNKPCVIIRSPELIKSIMIKDFEYFCNRNVYFDEKRDSIASNMLVTIKNPEWKLLRVKLSPVYTSAKLKKMWGLVHKTAKDLNGYIRVNTEKDFMDANDFCAKYTTDVISSCAFGIQANSFESENNEFRQACKKLLEVNWKGAFSQACYFIAPALVKLFNLKFLDPDGTDYLRDVFWKTVREREASSLKRNDLIDTIIQMKNDKTNADNILFEGDKVVAQPLVFLIAGFETSSKTIAFALYELSLNPTMQRKLRVEILTYLSHNGEFSYDTINDMKYLHMVLCETLRKYPVLPFLDRECVKDYIIPGDNTTIIEKGTAIFIPVHGLHFDPEYFPDPEQFDPERFSEENKKSIVHFSYLPFGEGPRGCIGERFGWVVTKLGLASLLSEYEVEPYNKTAMPVKFNPKSIGLSALGGIPVKFKKID